MLKHQHCLFCMCSIFTTFTHWTYLCHCLMCNVMVSVPPPAPRYLPFWALWSVPCWSARPPLKWSASCTCLVWCWVSATPCWGSHCWPGATASEVIFVKPFFQKINSLNITRYELVFKISNKKMSLFRLLFRHHPRPTGLPPDGNICLLRRHHFQYPCFTFV